MLTDTKMTRMMVHIGLGNDLESAKKRGLVTNSEEEEMFAQLQAEVKEILASGGSLAEFGLASWTEED